MMRNIGKCLLLIFVFLLLPAGAVSKNKYKYDPGHDYSVVLMSGAVDGKLVKAWATAKNADKAILLAKQDAVAAALFAGIRPAPETDGMGVGKLPPLVDAKTREANRKFFEDFFKYGHNFQYVTEINSSYPSGENNVKVPGGRRVGINLLLDYDGLKQMLCDKGVKKSLSDHFNAPQKDK